MAGRPKAKFDLKDFSAAWFDEILSLYKKGGSDVEIKGMIWEWRGSFSNDLWDRWLLEEVEFSETIKMGRILSECWWTKTGRENLQVGGFSYTGWYMNMKNRFKWKDRNDVTSDDEKIQTNIILLGKGEKPKKNSNN